MCASPQKTNVHHSRFVSEPLLSFTHKYLHEQHSQSRSVPTIPSLISVFKTRGIGVHGYLRDVTSVLVFQEIASIHSKQGRKRRNKEDVKHIRIIPMLPILLRILGILIKQTRIPHPSLHRRQIRRIDILLRQPIPRHLRKPGMVHHVFAPTM